ncbi:MAG: hypothetical protein ACLQPD_02940 [Desulfomonilaceae bacterium]
MKFPYPPILDLSFLQMQNKIAVGGIRSFSTAEGIVKQGKADYVSLARP